MTQETVSKYDRLYGALRDVSLHTKPSTIKSVESLTGRAETFIVETVRHQDSGDYIFIEYMDSEGVTRLALPPKVASVIAAQRESLTKRRRSIVSRATMKARLEAGEVLGFRKRGTTPVLEGGVSKCGLHGTKGTSDAPRKLGD